MQQIQNYQFLHKNYELTVEANSLKFIVSHWHSDLENRSLSELSAAPLNFSLSLMIYKTEISWKLSQFSRDEKYRSLQMLLVSHILRENLQKYWMTYQFFYIIIYSRMNVWKIHEICLMFTAKKYFPIFHPVHQGKYLLNWFKFWINGIRFLNIENEFGIFFVILSGIHFAAPFVLSEVMHTGL